MNINKNIAHFIIGSLSVGLAVTVPTIISQQKKLMKLHEQTSLLLDEQKKARAATSPTAEELYNPSKILENKKNLTSKSHDEKDLKSQDFNIEPESASKDQAILPSKHAINNAIQAAYAQPKQNSRQPYLTSQLDNSSNKSLETYAPSSKQEHDHDKHGVAKKTALQNELPINQLPASAPMQTVFPYNPSNQRQDIPKNHGPSYDSTMYLPVVVNSGGGSAVPIAAGSSGGTGGGTNTGNNTGNNTGTGTGTVANQDSNSTTSATLDNILSTLQFQIPAQGGSLINNGSVNQTRSHRIKRNRSSTQEYWTQPFTISTDDPTFDEVSIIRFQENITFKPSESSLIEPDVNAAIVVKKDNTIIDLYGFSLSLDTSDLSGFDASYIVHGIYIAPGIKNTKIISSAPQATKGHIKGFTGYGIFAQGSDIQADGDNDIDIYQIKQVEINNMVITENFNGIYLKNVLFAKIYQSNILSNVSKRTDTYGIYCLNSNGIIIDECKVNKNSSNFNIYGIRIQDCIGTSILNSQANFNQSMESGNAIGMQITATSRLTCHENTIFNCQANANLCAYANSVESIGFHITNQSSNNVIEKCSSSANKHGIPPLHDSVPTTLPIGYGFKLENSNHNQVHNNTSTTQFNYGFYDALIGSTTIYTGNKSFYNPTENYSIFFTTGTGAIEPLPTTIMYPGDLSSLSGSASSLINIEIKAAL